MSASNSGFADHCSLFDSLYSLLSQRTLYDESSFSVYASKSREGVVMSRWNFGEETRYGVLGNEESTAKFAARVNSTLAPDHDRVARWRSILAAKFSRLCAKGGPMYVARFSYEVLPINREQAIDFIRREVEAASRARLKGRLLVPLTRAHGGSSLQFELELEKLDQLEAFRHRGLQSRNKKDNWMKAFSKILLSPPVVELLRIDGP